MAATRLMGVNMSDQGVTISQANFNFMKSKGANAFLEQLCYQTWVDNASYRAHWTDFVNKLHAAGMLFILSNFGKYQWESDYDQNRYNAVYNTADRTAWINGVGNMISALQPDGVDPMNEPPGSIASADIKNFYLECVDNWVPRKANLFFTIEGAPYTDIKNILTSPRVDVSRPNVPFYYAVHDYYYFNGDGPHPTWGAPEMEAYWNGQLATAKTLLYTKYDNTFGVQAALNLGLNVMFQEFGGHILNPNILQYMQDAFDYAKARNISVLWIDWGINSHAPGFGGCGLIDDWTPTLNSMGQVWAANMVTAPLPPPQYRLTVASNPSNIPFNITKI